MAESFKSLSEFQKSVLNDETAKDFKPPGKLVHSYIRNQRNYEIWAGSLADPDVRALLDRIQIFVSFFIEAGTHIETNDFEWTLQRWTAYFVYVDAYTSSYICTVRLLTLTPPTIGMKSCRSHQSRQARGTHSSAMPRHTGGTSTSCVKSVRKTRSPRSQMAPFRTRSH